VVCAFILGYGGHELRRATVERRAVEEIERLGGRVIYDFELEVGDEDFANRAYNLYAQPPGPAWLRRFLGNHFFARPVEVFLSRRDSIVSDDDLMHLKSFTDLKSLGLEHTKISNKAIQFLSEKHGQQLRELSIFDTAVDDGALPYLIKMKRLQYLALPRDGFSEEAVQILRRELPDTDIRLRS